MAGQGMISGIIAEFNPFHNGHRYLLSQAEGLKVVIMSGNWLQRGEPAIIDKWTRAQMALANGADIVVELPFFASVQGADYFAQYAVQILAALGVTDLVFGTDARAVDYPQLVALYRQQSQAMQAFIDELPDSLSYPQKTQQMWQTFAGVQFDGQTPNHILGLAYTKAVASQAAKIHLRPVQRIGASFHDEQLDTVQAFASATALRAYSERDLSAFMPDFTVYQAAPKVSWTNYFPLLKYQIIAMSQQDLAQVFQSNEELAVRLKHAIKSAADVSALVANVATKRYTQARVRRLLTYILMQVEHGQNFVIASPHVLGFSPTGRQHLKGFDVITRVGKTYADQLTLRADAIYQLGNPALSEQNYGRQPIMSKERLPD
jgi:predicted nucleotidyltransferase